MRRIFPVLLCASCGGSGTQLFVALPSSESAKTLVLVIDPPNAPLQLTSFDLTKPYVLRATAEPNSIFVADYFLETVVELGIPEGALEPAPADDPRALELFPNEGYEAVYSGDGTLQFTKIEKARSVFVLTADRTSFTLSARAWGTVEPLDGVRACLREQAGPPCTATTNGSATLVGLELGTDYVVELERSDLEKT